jgi:hypothetical protein
MKRTISLKLQPSDAWSAEELGTLIARLKFIICEPDKGGVGLRTTLQFHYAQNTTEVKLEFTDSAQKDSPSTTGLQNKICLTT